MSIPLDRLYHFIDQTAREIYGEPVLIYRFWPHGSKNINHLTKIANFDKVTNITIPSIWCHDQEPLHYQLYKDRSLRYQWWILVYMQAWTGTFPPINLNYEYNAFIKNILLHSEKRSDQVDKYVQDVQLIPVY